MSKVMAIGEGGYEYGKVNGKYKIQDVVKSVKDELEKVCEGSAKKVSDFRLQVCYEGEAAAKDGDAILKALQEYGSPKISFSCPQKYSHINKDTGVYTDSNADSPADFERMLKSGSLKTDASCTYKKEFVFKEHESEKNKAKSGR